ncbi:phosphate signaling complex protein PhoU [bacterium]|nr:phosphate signaling complex protein PhoU [bacterium]
MSVHLHRDIERLKKKVLSLGAMVEEAISAAIAALLSRDEKAAKRVIASDREIDQMEVEVEEDCLKILALYQPVASDLRFVIAVLKMNNDLERMGDLAANIAKRAVEIMRQPGVELPAELPTMARNAQAMVKSSLDALVNMDATLARQVCAGDDELDGFRKRMQRRVLDEIRAHPDDAEALMGLSNIFRHLERLGDMATNIAEDVIYLVEGEITRHREN